MTMLSTELWQPIPKYEGFYEVSNTGKVRSVDHYANGFNGKKLKRGKECKPYFRGEYLSVALSKEGVRKQYSIHRLVGMVYVPNTENKPTINHNDGVKTNNNDWNLEWATRSEQLIHAIKMGLYSPPQPTIGKFGAEHNRSKAVTQYTLDMQPIASFGSANEAARLTGFYQTGISKCCRGEIKKHKEYVWKYE